MRKVLLAHQEILNKLDELVKKVSVHDKELEQVFKYLNALEKSRKDEKQFQERTKIGYKIKGKE